MNYILHGDDHVKSRQRLNELILEARDKEWDVTRLDGVAVSRTELLDSVRGQALFSQNRLLILENLFSSRGRTSDLLKELDVDGKIMLAVWEGKKIDGRRLRGFEKNFKIELFSIPVAVFNFLDSLAPKNATAALRFMRKIPTADFDYLLYQIASRVRDLIWLKENPESFELPPQRRWTRGKLTSQAKKWELFDLYALHSKLLELDRQNKRSQLPENLGASLDLLVASI